MLEKMFKRGLPGLSVISYVQELKRQLRDCDSVLDIGCGRSSPIQYLKLARSVGLDGHPPSVAQARETHTHTEVLEGDIRSAAEKFRPGEFDACVALDVIEHLNKEEGLQLLRSMEKIARKKILITTPNGFMSQRSFDNNDLQEHLSAWEAPEMKGLGFRVYGLLGHKALRGELHALRYRPLFLWAIVSEITQHLYARSHPEKAAALMCVRVLDGKV